MKGLSEAPPANYFPEEAGQQLVDAYTKLGYGQGAAQRRKELEEKAKKKKKKNLWKTAAIIGAAALTGGAAAALAPAAIGAGAAGAAGAGAAGAGTAAASGGLMSGLSTFGSGALGALTGSGSVAAGTGGLAGALSTGAGVLGSMGTNMLMSSAMGGGGGGGMGGSMGGDGGMDVGQAAMGALGSYMQQVQSANKTSRVLEGTLKDPAVRSAIYGPNFNDQQSSAVMEYAKTLGAVDKAAYLQRALPSIAQQAAATTEFARQLQMQGLRNEPTYARGLAELASSRGGGGGVVLPLVQEKEPADFTQFGRLPARPRETQDFSGEWRGIPYRYPGQ